MASGERWEPSPAASSSRCLTNTNDMNSERPEGCSSGLSPFLQHPIEPGCSREYRFNQGIIMKLASTLSVVILLAVVGCGPDTSHLPATVPAEGIVTLDGQPVENATVMFIADTGNHHATANTDAQGKFRLSAFKEKEGAVPGTYKVEVNKTIVSGAGG